jgi:hypothetical protein
VCVIVSTDSHPLQLAIRFGGKRDTYLIAGVNHSTRSHDAHDTGLANELAFSRAIQHCRHDPWLKRGALTTRVAQSSEMQDYFVTHLKLRTNR